MCSLSNELGALMLPRASLDMMAVRADTEQTQGTGRRRLLASAGPVPYHCDEGDVLLLSADFLFFSGHGTRVGEFHAP